MHGVQARILEKTQGRALFVHCSAHRLNLATVGSIRQVGKALDLFHNLGLLYGFLATSVVDFMYEQPRGNNNRLDLQRLSDTRWVCQHAASYSARSNLPVIVDVLESFAKVFFPRTLSGELQLGTFRLSSIPTLLHNSALWMCWHARSRCTLRCRKSNCIYRQQTCWLG